MRAFFVLAKATFNKTTPPVECSVDVKIYPIPSRLMDLM